MNSDATIPYREFARQVRRLPRTRLLTACAAVTADQIGDPENEEKQYAFPTFAIAGIARASAIYGNDHRSQIDIQDPQLRQLCSAFVNVHDQFIDNQQLAQFFCRIANEQLSLQGALFNDIARAQAMLADAATEYGSSLITESYWQGVLGCSTQDLCTVALILHASAIGNSGHFDPAWLQQPNLEPLYKIIPKCKILDVYDRLFCGTPEHIRELANVDLPEGDLERYAFNPLRTRPIVATAKGPHIAPVAHFIMLRAGPGVLYYDAIKSGGRQFASELGHVFQFYVGKQLRLTKGTVHDEVVFDGDRGQERSVDFIVALPEVVVLVECKAIPMGADGRRGQPQMHDDIDRVPGKASDQIDKTASLIRDNHPEFLWVPRDRPLIGLIVTLDPYYTISVRKPRVDTWLASIRDLEQLMTIKLPSVGEFLIKRPIGPDVPLVSTELRNASLGRNAILDEAWRKMPLNPSSLLIA